jgi:hypothetical protein
MIEPGCRPQQRRLARTIRANDSRPLSRCERNRKILQDLLMCDPDIQSLY